MSQQLATLNKMNRPYQTCRVGYDMPAMEFKSGTEVLEHSRALYARLHARPAPVVARVAPVVEIERTAPIYDAPEPERPKEMHQPKWKRILTKVCRKHGVSVKDVLSSSRFRNVTRARQEAVYHVIIETGLTYPAVGRLFNRDHSTAIHCFNMHKKRLESGEVPKHEYLSVSKPRGNATPKQKADALVRAKALELGVTPAQITGCQRRDDLHTARKEIYLALYIEHGLNYSEIARWMGDRSHATIINAIGHLVAPQIEEAA